MQQMPGRDAYLDGLLDEHKKHSGATVIERKLSR